MKLMTEKQKALIDDMNDFCRNKFAYNDRTTSKEAGEYISKNIEEFKLMIADDWTLRYM